MFPSLSAHLAALALCATDVVVRAVRLRLLVPGDARLSLWQAVTINAYGDAASAVTPGRVGGDPARFLACRRAGVEAPRVLAGLAVEALIDWVLLAAATVVLGLVFADTAAAGARHLVALALGSAAAARWYRRRLPTGALGSIPAAWQRARRLGWACVTLAATITAVSMALRVAILPVLVAGQPGLATGAVVLGSFTLLFGQLALPTPAGAGAVELGFVGGFAGTLSAATLATLLIAWRVYTLILPAALGALLFAREALGRRRQVVDREIVQGSSSASRVRDLIRE